MANINRESRCQIITDIIVYIQSYFYLFSYDNLIAKLLSSIISPQQVSAPRNAQIIVTAHQKRSMKAVVNILARDTLQNNILYTIIPQKYKYIFWFIYLQHYLFTLFRSKQFYFPASLYSRIQKNIGDTKLKIVALKQFFLCIIN